MELTVEQIYIVGVVASVLSVVVKLLSARFGLELGKLPMTIVVSVVSVLLAVLFNLPALPQYVEPLQYISEWLALASTYVGAATIIYNIILDKLLDALNLTVDRFLR